MLKGFLQRNKKKILISLFGALTLASLWATRVHNDKVQEVNFNLGVGANIAENITFFYTGSTSTIPTGWSRDTDFDGLYVLGASSTDTTGGDTGGYATHTHAISSTHTHALTANNSSGATTDSNIGGTVAGDPHQHGSVNLSANAPTVASASNTPPFYEAIAIKSDGTPTNVPYQAIFWGNSAQYIPSPFSEYYYVANSASGTPNLIGKYIKGADTDQDAGDTGGTSNHRHNFSHNHTTPITSGTSNNISPYRVSRGANIVGSHTHSVNITNSGSAGAYNSSSENGNPLTISLVPWFSATSTNVLENGIIAMWKGAKADIPNCWAEVESLRDYFVKATDGTGTAYYDEETGIWYYSFSDIGDITGSETHHHDSSHSHIGTTAGITTAQYLTDDLGITSVASYLHTHTWNISSSDANFSNNTSRSNYPPYIKVFFIKYDEAYCESQYYGQVI